MNSRLICSRLWSYSKESHQDTELLEIWIYGLIYFDESCLQIYDRLENKLIIIKKIGCNYTELVECLNINKKKDLFLAADRKSDRS